MVIALYAPAGSGKSTVLRIFAEHGWTALDQDGLVHKLLEQHAAELAALFGSGVLEGGVLSRSKLGDLVFSSPEKREQLESFLYPLIRVRTLKLIKGNTLIEGANLYKVLGEYPIDKTLTVTVPQDILRRRLGARGHTEVWIEQVLAVQEPLFQAQKYADLSIDNSGSLEELRIQTEALLASLF